MNGNYVKEKVLFICTHNSARSQMAEGLLRSLYGDFYEVYSAGTEPTSLNPYAVMVMAEIGIDISKQRSKSISEFRNSKFDWVVTICDQAKERCPYFPAGVKRLHKSFQDPSTVRGSEAEILERFRNVRDQIKEWIDEIFSK
ncbi:MAG: arsenate reductase ArsC [Candidatus Bathyarchaeia archaeon]|nr:arsenate reductase ArsC [Candidatus Bathyarchaeota archaeon]